MIFTDIRRPVTEFRVQAEAGVEADDVGGHIASAFGMVVRPDTIHDGFS